MTTTPKKTKLNDIHRQLGGKMVDFAGWDMPVEYSGLRLEHMATREAVGLFDVSHMGEVMVHGPNAVGFLQKLLSNDVSKCAIGQAQYNMMLNEQGGVVDDLIIYRLEENKFLLVVNASNKDKDLNWISVQAKKFNDQTTNTVFVKDESEDWAQVAIQGPKATELVAELFPESSSIKKFRFKNLSLLKSSLSFNSISNALPEEFFKMKWLVARTGYTGEDGFEIYGPNEGVLSLWTILLELGKKFGALPCGLGARNTLRIEAALPLYGNEINDQMKPLNIGMNWALKVAKDTPFVGQTSLLEDLNQNKGDALNHLVGLVSLEKAIPRDGYKVFSLDKTPIGKVTSGTFSPSLNQPISMALIDKSYSNSTCLIEVRKSFVEAKIVSLPFMSKK